MYGSEITRMHRTAFVIAIDQSCSMHERITVNSRRMTKAEAVASITSRLIDELLMRARREDGVRNYYDIAVVGYADDNVYPLLDDSMEFVPVTLLAGKSPMRRRFSYERLLPSGELRMVTEETPLWIEPHAAGSTPMYEMLSAVTEMVGRWCAEPQNADSFPPMVFNITDGEATDCDDRQLCEAAERLKRCCTRDGGVLLVNVHISTNSGQESMIFPRRDEIGADNRYARLLAEMSSTVPEPMNEAVRRFRGDFALPPFIAMSYNASITEAVALLDIGSRSATVLR